MADSLQTIDSENLQMSSIGIEPLDPLVDDTWDNIVITRDEHSIFHRSAWARVLAQAYEHRPYYLRISVAGVESALVPLMEVKSCLTGRRGVSLPFSDFTGPLWSDATKAPLVYQAVLNFATERGWKHIEVRGGTIPSAGAQAFLTYDTHQLDLRQGIESIERRLDPSVRRAIRKAERSRIEVTVERSLSAMAEFYKLHGRTRRRHGLPPQPFVFFKAIATHLIECGLGEIVLAKLAGVPVAGAVFLRSGGQVIYKFGASDSEHWPLRPNHLVMWNAIQHYTGSGCRELHFGRTSQNDEGLSRFKTSWGCDAIALPYFRRSLRNDKWDSASRPRSESHPLIFGHLPICLNRLAGRLIYPHLD